MSMQSEESLRRVRARVDGTVQGVGYRPFVYRLADELGIAGWVLNDERGVLVEAEGSPAAVEAFVARLSSDAPPLAEVRGVQAEPPRRLVGAPALRSSPPSAVARRPRRSRRTRPRAGTASPSWPIRRTAATATPS